MQRGIPILLLILLIVTPASAATEAEILALEASGEKLPPPELVTQIESELWIARNTFPVLEKIEAMPDWIPGELLIGLTEEAAARFEAGEFTELDELNDALQLVAADRFGSSTAYHFRYQSPYNPELLVPDYEGIEGVRYAEPNGVMGDGPDIRWEEPGLYTFRYAWGDCPAGCLQEHLWRIRVQDGGAEIVEEWGQELPVWLVAPQSSFGVLKGSFGTRR